MNNRTKHAKDEFRQRIKSSKSLFDELEEEVLSYGIEDLESRNELLRNTEEALKLAVLGMKLHR